MIPSVLVIMKEPVPFIRQLGPYLQNLAHIHPAATGMDGLFLFQKMNPHPLVVIIDEDLPDLHGSSVASIIKDMKNEDMKEGPESIVYVINVTNLLQNAKADYFMQKPVNIDMLFLQVKQDIEKHLLINSQSDAIQKAVSGQIDMLPQSFRKERFEITNIFSPYNDLSGDGIYYWYPEQSKEKDCLYGYLFDCTGHDISSYGQCSSLWFSLRKELMDFQRGIHPTLSSVMEGINNMFMEFSYGNDEPNMPAVISFYFDFRENVMHYCSAGNPELLYRKRSSKTFESIKMRSSPFGYFANTQYKEETLKLDGIQEVIFASDGFSELLLRNQFPDFPSDSAKHDDVSVIFVRLLEKPPFKFPSRP